jgi:hypothetical protein
MPVKHVCELVLKGDYPPVEILDPCYGVAFHNCIEDDNGRLWIQNGEYASQVNYCPICGYKAPTQITT